MSAPRVTSADVSAPAPNAKSVLGDWYGRHCRGTFATLLSDLLFPTSSASLQVRMDTNTFTFHPLPFCYDNVMLIGRRNGKNLTVVFYDRANRKFLPAYVMLPYEYRIRLVGRGRHIFVASLVSVARREEALATA